MQDSTNEKTQQTMRHNRQASVQDSVHDVKGEEDIGVGRKILLMLGIDVSASKVSHTLPNPFYQQESCQKYKSSGSGKISFSASHHNSAEEFDRYSEFNSWFRRTIDVILGQCGPLWSCQLLWIRSHSYVQRNEKKIEAKYLEARCLDIEKTTYHNSSCLTWNFTLDTVYKCCVS